MAEGCGKVILFGEHGVVYGRPALALAVARGAEVRALPAEADVTTLQVEPFSVQVDTGSVALAGREQLQQALKVACATFADDAHLALHAQVHVPGGAGLGSSAALGVAVVRALAEGRGQTISNDEVYARSLAWERVFHGNPSGIDNAMATYGGLLLFRKGEPLKPIVPRRPIRLVAAFSGETASTKTMVESVARAQARDPQRVSAIFDGMEAIVRNGKLAIETGDLRAMGQLMTLNHRLLSSLMLSTMTIEDMIASAEQAGALGAKVTGAGGGGCIIALVDTDKTRDAVHAAMAGLGKLTFDVESGP